MASEKKQFILNHFPFGGFNINPMKTSSKKNVVEVEIRGGLGNQLFSYFAGLYLSELNDSKLKLKICQPATNETVHGLSLIHI